VNHCQERSPPQAGRFSYALRKLAVPRQHFPAGRLPTLRAVADSRDGTSPFRTIAWHHLCAAKDVFCELCGLPLDLPVGAGAGRRLVEPGRNSWPYGAAAEPLEVDWARSFARNEDSHVRAIVLPEICGDGPACGLVYGTPGRSCSPPCAQTAGRPPEGVVLRVRNVRPAKDLLTSRQRREPVRGAFATHPGSQVDNRRVLLVDH
jgi:hypothetical protein